MVRSARAATSFWAGNVTSAAFEMRDRDCRAGVCGFGPKGLRRDEINLQR